MSKSQYNPHLDLPPESPSQQQVASVYPKLPPSEELPSYESTVYNMPQPSTIQPQQQQQQYPYPQYAPPPPQQQHQHHQQQNRPPVMIYGSITPPNLNITAQQQIIQPITALRTKTETVQCPHCYQYVSTVIDYESGLCTGLSVGGLFLVGCHSGGCLLPFLFPWTKDVSHICPSCKQKIATFTRLERDTRIAAVIP